MQIMPTLPCSKGYGISLIRWCGGFPFDLFGGKISCEKCEFVLEMTLVFGCFLFYPLSRRENISVVECAFIVYSSQGHGDKLQLFSFHSKYFCLKTKRSFFIRLKKKLGLHSDARPDTCPSTSQNCLFMSKMFSLLQGGGNSHLTPLMRKCKKCANNIP